jgi:hypothetical protein
MWEIIDAYRILVRDIDGMGKFWRCRCNMMIRSFELDSFGHSMWFSDKLV